jgi:hypothetical protein
MSRRAWSSSELVNGVSNSKSPVRNEHNSPKEKHVTREEATCSLPTHQSHKSPGASWWWQPEPAAPGVLDGGHTVIL